MGNARGVGVGGLAGAVSVESVLVVPAVSTNPALCGGGKEGKTGMSNMKFCGGCETGECARQVGRRSDTERTSRGDDDDSTLWHAPGRLSFPSPPQIQVTHAMQADRRASMQQRPSSHSTATQQQARRDSRRLESQYSVGTSQSLCESQAHEAAMRAPRMTARARMALCMVLAGNVGRSKKIGWCRGAQECV